MQVPLRTVSEKTYGTYRSRDGIPDRVGNDGRGTGNDGQGDRSTEQGGREDFITCHSERSEESFRGGPHRSGDFLERPQMGQGRKGDTFIRMDTLRLPPRPEGKRRHGQDAQGVHQGSPAGRHHELCRPGMVGGRGIRKARVRG